MKKNKKYSTVIVADGSFPSHTIPIGYLKNARRIICCDGSAETLVKKGFIPDAIVGDMDSLSKAMAVRFSDRLFTERDQDTNDLTKSILWCKSRGYTSIVIVGATGKREDHTIGNISLLVEYAIDTDVIMVTDTGILIPLLKSNNLSSYPGQQVSIFSIGTDTELSSQGLRYPLYHRKLNNWWCATLNEAVGESFTLEFSEGRVIVYLQFP